MGRRKPVVIGTPRATGGPGRTVGREVPKPKHREGVERRVMKKRREYGEGG
jgi:hypothetical protein